jgi:hypothetical protein
MQYAEKEKLEIGRREKGHTKYACSLIDSVRFGVSHQLLAHSSKTGPGQR